MQPAGDGAGGAAQAGSGAARRVEAKLQGVPYARPVDVAAAGWVRVPLDLAALRHLGRDSSVRILSPAGEEVQRWTLPYVADSERRPVKVQGVQEGAKGWTLRLDVGPEPLVHERLLLDFARLATVPAVTLEGSPDGRTWTPLVADDLFRLGQGDGLARTSLLYPATSVRYLRLDWPREAGFPELRSVLVEPTLPERSLTVTSPNNPCHGGATPATPATVACRLPLPAAGQTVRRLTVELAGGSVIGFQLYKPGDGTWEPLTQGVWRGDNARHVVPLPSGPLAADMLRLELFAGTGDPPPRLLSHSFDLAVETVMFYAETAGRFTLSYGGAPAKAVSETPPDGRPLAAAGDAAWVTPGPEEAGRLAPLPAAAALGAKLVTGRFHAAWAVTAANAAPGDLVRLQLPDIVYGQARPDLGDLRLAVANRQVPYVRWSAPEPVLVLERSDLKAEPEKGGRYSHVEVPLPAAALPLTEIRLAAPPAALRRPVGVRYPDPGPPGLARRDERLVAHAGWDCVPEPPLPCRLVLPLPGRAPRHLTVRFADGDNPPLAAVDVTVWRHGDVLLFAWPGQGNVQLLAGAPELRAPVYDLAALADVLPSRPWQSAEVNLAGDLQEVVPPWWSRWVLPFTLAAAGLFLLVLLRRIVTEV
jgi:hypothetical protein